MPSQIDENQFSFDSNGECVFLIENKNQSTARLAIPYGWSGEKAEKTGITLDLNREAEPETIRITLPEQECEDAFFLFFNGKNVQEIKASEGS